MRRSVGDGGGGGWRICIARVLTVHSTFLGRDDLKSSGLHYLHAWFLIFTKWAFIKQRLLLFLPHFSQLKN